MYSKNLSATNSIITSCGKIMFLHLSISHSVHRGCVWWTSPWADAPLAGTPPPQADTTTRQTPPLADTPQARTPKQAPLPGRHPTGETLPGQTSPSPWALHGHCSGRYASYWNAFLFDKFDLNFKAEKTLFSELIVIDNLAESYFSS